MTNGSNPTLYVRSPSDPDDREVVYTFPDDDPYVSFGRYLMSRYFGEFSTFIDAVESPSGDASLILSSFEDAVKTYDLTWRIREASEESTRELFASTLDAASATLGATRSGSAPTCLESTITPTAGPTGVAGSADESTNEHKGLMESVKEGVEKLGLGGKF